MSKVEQRLSNTVQQHTRPWKEFGYSLLLLSPLWCLTASSLSATLVNRGARRAQSKFDFKDYWQQVSGGESAENFMKVSLVENPWNLPSRGEDWLPLSTQKGWLQTLQRPCKATSHVESQLVSPPKPSDRMMLQVWIFACLYRGLHDGHGYF